MPLKMYKWMLKPLAQSQRLQLHAAQSLSPYRRVQGLLYSGDSLIIGTFLLFPSFLPQAGFTWCRSLVCMKGGIGKG